MAVVLVADDDPAMREALGEALIDMGHETRLADSGATALAWISTSAYSPKTKPGFARHEVKTSCMSFHQGTVTGLFSSPEASTIGR